MHKKLSLTLLGCMIVVMALGFATSSWVRPAAASTPRLELVVSGSAYTVNAPILVYVRATNPGALSAFEFTLQVDSTLAAVSAIQAQSPLGVSGACDPAAHTCAVALGPKDKTDGTHLAIYTYGVANPVTTDQTIAVFTLQPKGKAGRVSLHLTSPLITNASGQAVIPLTSDVSFDLVENTPIYLPFVGHKRP